VSLNRQKKCSECNGVGAKRPEDIQTCPECRGSGVKVFIRQMGMGIQQIQTTCDKCQGRGRVFKSVCSRCKGAKMSRQEEPLKVEIEAGCPDGHVIKYENGADEGGDGVEAGDLYIVIRTNTEPHPTFTRDKNNLYVQVEIGLMEALLGFKRSIKHLDGHMVSVKRDGVVTQPNQVLTVKGEGMPACEVAPRGDLYVTVKVVLPGTLTDGQRKVLVNSKEFASIRDRDEL
jgi:DnaJ-related protein SCJ1